jgi:hypothetical protein
LLFGCSLFTVRRVADALVLCNAAALLTRCCTCTSTRKGSDQHGSSSCRGLPPMQTSPRTCQCNRLGFNSVFDEKIVFSSASHFQPLV